MGYWVKVNNDYPCFTFPDENGWPDGGPCGFVGGGGPSGPTDFDPVFVRGDGNADHIPSFRVNYIAFTHSTQQYINNVFPASWTDNSRVPGSGIFEEQDVIYTDFWDWAGQYNQNVDFSYYKDGYWQPNIILWPGRGYVLKTRNSGYIKWRLN